MVSKFSRKAVDGTTQVSFLSLFVDEIAGTGFFDDLQATLIPKPTSFAVVSLGGVARLVRYDDAFAPLRDRRRIFVRPHCKGS
jgi:hypothetical protein